MLVGALCQSSSQAVTLGYDNASQAVYTDGWQPTDNGGAGFSAWTFAYSGVTSTLLHPAQFIDNGPLVGNTLGAPAFGLTTSDRANQTDTSEVRRSFGSPLVAGQTLSLDVDGSALNTSAQIFSIGNTLDLYGTNGSKRFSLFTNNGYHNSNWTATGNLDTGIPADSAFHIDFTLATADSYDLVLSPIGGGAPLFSRLGVPLEGTTGVAISRLRLSTYGTGSSFDGSKEFFFNNLALADTVGTADYNKNGFVDAADYVVWRNSEMGPDAGILWRATFGNAVGGSSLSAASLPEPSSLFTAGSVLAAAVIRMRRRSC
jgi:hypothetical protein